MRCTSWRTTGANKMTDLKKLKEDFKAYFADLKENAKEEGFKVCRRSEWEFFLIAAQNREAE
jgi:hypothetical protein